MPQLPFRVALVLSSALVFSDAAALADVTKEQCIDANAKAQPLRRAGKLREARALLSTCNAPSCPAIVRDDCAERLDEIERAQPTLVFDAKDAAGADLAAVRVMVDGHLVVDRLDGTALAVDPGAHAFTFELAGQDSVTRNLVVKESEKGRREQVVFANRSEAIKTAPVLPPPHLAAPSSGEAPPFGLTDNPPPPHGAPGSSQKTIAYVFGGAAIAGLAAGSVFGLLASSAWSSSQNECSAQHLSNCASQRSLAVSDHDAASTDAAIATVAFVAGGVLAAAGAVLFVTAPSGTSTTGRLEVVPSVGPRAGGFTLQGGFN